MRDGDARALDGCAEPPAESHLREGLPAETLFEEVGKPAAFRQRVLLDQPLVVPSPLHVGRDVSRHEVRIAAAQSRLHRGRRFHHRRLKVRLDLLADEAGQSGPEHVGGVPSLQQGRPMGGVLHGVGKGQELGIVVELCPKIVATIPVTNVADWAPRMPMPLGLPQKGQSWSMRKPAPTKRPGVTR